LVRSPRYEGKPTASTPSDVERDEVLQRAPGCRAQFLGRGALIGSQAAERAVDVKIGGVE
jgi:hypothetical protein